MESQFYLPTVSAKELIYKNLIRVKWKKKRRKKWQIWLCNWLTWFLFAWKASDSLFWFSAIKLDRVFNFWNSSLSIQVLILFALSFQFAIFSTTSDFFIPEICDLLHCTWDFENKVENWVNFLRCQIFY